MKTFTEPLKELKEFETLSAGVHDLRGIAQISGCIDAETMRGKWELRSIIMTVFQTQMRSLHSYLRIRHTRS